jgi:hypothetical protein
MKYLKLYESFKDHQDLTDEVLDLFYDFEEAGFHVKGGLDRIVKDRDDWSGNLTSTKLRNVSGQKFIMSHQGQIWKSESVLLVRVSKLSYIQELNNETIYKHWKEIDSEVLALMPKIQTRAGHLLDMKLVGIMSGWFQLGKASHPDYENRPYYGWDILSDFWMIAFQKA